MPTVSHASRYCAASCVLLCGALPRPRRIPYASPADFSQCSAPICCRTPDRLIVSTCYCRVARPALPAGVLRRDTCSARSLTIGCLCPLMPLSSSMQPRRTIWSRVPSSGFSRMSPYEPLEESLDVTIPVKLRRRSRSTRRSPAQQSRAENRCIAAARAIAPTEPNSSPPVSFEQSRTHESSDDLPRVTVIAPLSATANSQRISSTAIALV
jgi:hypothetical protein